MRLFVSLAGLIFLGSGIACKPRQNDSLAKDLQLTSLSERKNYVVFQDDNSLVNVRECPPDAVPGRVAENVVAPQDCKNVDADTLNRAHCNVPLNAEPIPLDLFKDRLLQSMNLQNAEGTIKNLDSQRIELTRMEKDLDKLSKIVAANPTSGLAEEEEKARVTVDNLRSSVAALEAEVNRNRQQLDTYKKIVTSLECSQGTQFFKGQSEYTQILAPFESRSEAISQKKTLNQRLQENVPLGHTTTIEFPQSGKVAAISVQIDLRHDYPHEVGIEITSPDGKVASIPTLFTTKANEQLQIGLINKTYIAEMLRLSGAQINGTWKIRYGDESSDTGTVHAITLTLHPFSPALIDAIVAYAPVLQEWSVPQNTVQVLPFMVSRDQLIEQMEFSLDVGGSQDIEVTVVNPTGVGAAMVKKGTSFVLDAAGVNTFLSKKSGGLWALTVRNKSKDTAAQVKNQKMVFNQGRNNPASTPAPGTGAVNPGNQGSAQVTQPGPRATVSMSDVNAAMTASRQKYSTYNNDKSAVDGCKSAGASVGWTATMQEYYCTFPISNPEIRTCFTGSVRGQGNFQKKSYPEAYDFCATSYAGTPMKWIKDNQDSVFRAVMLDKKF